VAPGPPHEYAEGVPASTVAANTPIRLSIARRALIASLTILLLAAATGAAWVNTQLAPASSSSVLRLDVDGLRLALNPRWRAVDNRTPAPLTNIGPVETFADPAEPQRQLTVAVARTDTPAANIAVVLFNQLLSQRSAEDGDLTVNRPTPVKFNLIGDLQSFAINGKSVANEDRAIVHHYVAVIFQPGSDKRWVLYLEDRSAPGQPLPNARETANNQIVGGLLSTARPSP